MKKLKDFVETGNATDELIMEMDVDFNLYNSLQEMSRATCQNIEDDRAFCDAEWNLFQEWNDVRGFTEDDMLYAIACGYAEDQFEREDDDYDERMF